jgi:peptide deformylase
MAVEIRIVGDPVLRKRAKAVQRVNRAVREILDEMVKTMEEARGVGLAAPQVGIEKRLIVVDVGEGPIYLVNPEIIWSEGECTAVEGCLSVPGYVGDVRRAERVRVTGIDREGRHVWVEGDGLLARALQHEIDHLDGVLFTDVADRVMEAQEGLEEAGVVE